MGGTPYDSPDEVTDADLAALAKDWIALVESELAAWLTDREAQETWAALLALWSRGVDAALRGAADAGGGSAAWAAAGDAAPDAGDAERVGLARRLAALEARVVELEAKPKRGKPKRGKSRRAAKPSAGRAAGADRGRFARVCLRDLANWNYGHPAVTRD